MDIRYRDGTAEDVEAIDHVFRRTFCDTFAHLYRPADLEIFLADFTRKAWADEMRDPRFGFRLAEAGGDLVGYAKIGPLSLPVDTAEPAAEFRQIYILHSWHGRGIAAALMDWTVAQARRRGCRELYLTVYVENHRARRVYDRYGFVPVGPYHFMVGEHADDDIIMRLDL